MLLRKLDKLNTMSRRDPSHVLVSDFRRRNCEDIYK